MLVHAIVAHSDFVRMQCSNRGNRAPVPLWTQSDAKVRHVCLHRLALQAKAYRGTLPTSQDEIKTLENLAIADLSKSHRKRLHLRVVERFGGLLAYTVSLIYRRYRMRLNSQDLAEYYGEQPSAIRQQLYRLNLVARLLYPDDENHLRRHTGAFKTLKDGWFLGEDEIAEAIQLYEQGMEIKQIASRLHRNPHTIGNHLRERVTIRPVVVRILELSSRGVTHDQIGKQLGLSRESITKSLARYRSEHGISTQRQPRHDIHRALELLASGLTQRETAQQIGCTLGTLKGLLWRHRRNNVN